MRFAHRQLEKRYIYHPLNGSERDTHRAAVVAACNDIL